MILFMASAFGNPAHQTILQPSDSTQIVQVSNTTPAHTVYGYLPYWTTSPATVSLSGLTHIAYFDAEITSNGSLSNTQRWANAAQDLVPRAHAAGVSVHLCVTAFSDSIINSVLSSSSRRATLISDIVTQVNTHQADGINIDIEGLDGSQRDNFNTFIIELSQEISDIVIATPAVDWNDAYDYTTLADYATLFIMAYDYHWSGGDPGPVDPLFGGGAWGQFSIEWSVNNYFDHNVSPDKLIVGLPLYGRSWSTVNDSVPGTSTGSSSAVVMHQAIDEAASSGYLYDVITESPYILYSNEQVWFPNVESVETRILWALDQDVQGIGFWALGYENGVNEFWPMVTGTVGTLDTDIPDEPDDTGSTDMNQAPIANAGLDQTVIVGSTITLDGRLSMDPDGDELAYSWSIIEATSQTFSDNLSSTPSIETSEVGTWTIQLIVSDGQSMSTDTAIITVEPSLTDSDEELDGTDEEAAKSGCNSASSSHSWWMLFAMTWIPFRRQIR